MKMHVGGFSHTRGDTQRGTHIKMARLSSVVEGEASLGEEEEVTREAVEGEEDLPMARAAIGAGSKGILQVIARSHPNAMAVWRRDTSVQTVQTKGRHKKR